MAGGSSLGLLTRREKTLSRRMRYLTRGRRVASFMGRQVHRLLDAEHSQQLKYICGRVCNASGWENHSNLVYPEGALDAIQQCNALLKQHDALQTAIRCRSLNEYGKKRFYATLKHCASRTDPHIRRRNSARVCRGLPVLCTLRRDARLTRVAHFVSVTLLSSSASEMLTKLSIDQSEEEYVVQLAEHACSNRFSLKEPATVGVIGDVRTLVWAWCVSSLARRFRTNLLHALARSIQPSPVHLATAMLSSATLTPLHALLYLLQDK
jgi:hypothetical protein